jgi:hypothetical protein
MKIESNTDWKIAAVIKTMNVVEKYVDSEELTMQEYSLLSAILLQIGGPPEFSVLPKGE